MTTTDNISPKQIHNFRIHLVEFLKGGFAPNVILLREFQYEKAGIILEGLHFSAWVLLGHLHARHCDFLKFIKNPDQAINLWPDAPWPENYQPNTRKEWDRAIDHYEKDLHEMIAVVADTNTDLFKIYIDDKSITWAAMTVMHHTGYHIGQLKTIGRQLGVW